MVRIWNLKGDLLCACVPYIPIMRDVLADMDPDVVNDVMSSYIISNMGDCSRFVWRDPARGLLGD